MSNDPRRTPPHGVRTTSRMRSVIEPPDSDDDVTSPPVDLSELEQNAWRLRRLERKNSEVNSLFQGIESRMAVVDESRANMALRIGNLEVAQSQTGKEVRQIKEGQIGLAHVANQIFEEVKKINGKESERERFQRSESGAWKRQLVQSLIALVAVAVALASLLINRC